MTVISQLELVLLLLVVVLALVTAARRVLIPYPILLVIGGGLLAFLPHLPPVPLQPDLVFLVFLPPILWSAAFFTSRREFRANLRPITALAIGLVCVTTVVVAMVAHAIAPEMGWPAAVVLGAIVSPPDAVAATTVMRRLDIPRRVVAVLEGESLVNDASALIIYRAAVAAVVTGAFALGHTLAEFAVAAVGGVAVGLIVGALVRVAVRLTDDTIVDIAITFLGPYVAWVAAEQLHTSAVLACVAGGLYLRRPMSVEATPATRLQARSVWELVVFLLNGVIFILIGLQLGTLRSAVPASETGRVLRLVVAVSIAVIVVRFVWVPIVVYLPRWLSRSLRERDPIPPRSWTFLVSWIGMRGILSLAAALALPLTTATGAPFPFRTELILVTFAVIFVTLVLQGLTLAPLIRRLHFGYDDTQEREQTLAREHAAAAALEKLEALAPRPWVQRDQLDRLRAYYQTRHRRFSVLGDPECSDAAAAAYRRLRHQAITAERGALIALRDRGEISDDVLGLLENELDIEALRIGAGGLRALPGALTITGARPVPAATTAPAEQQPPP